MSTMSTTPESAVPLLAMRGIVKEFPGVRALDGVDFTLRRGEIHALMGENGAGKSTLIKVLTGVHRRDAGTVHLEGKPIHPHTPLAAQECGISTVYQEINLVPTLSVAENILLGRQPRRWWGVDWGELYRRARKSLERIGVDVDVRRPLGSLPTPLQQMVAIARALDVSARVLVLDEPTSSLDSTETCILFDLLGRLKAQGLGILLVTHFLGQVYQVSDRITVLRNGRLIGEFETARLPRLALVEHMLGRSPPETLYALGAPPAGGKPAGTKKDAAPGKTEGGMSVQGLARERMLHAVDFELPAGQMLGLAGLLGSGRTETLRLAFAADRPDAGTVRVGTRPVPPRSPRQSIARGMAFCSEDRKAEGIFPDLSVRENIVLALQARRGWLRRLPRKQQQALVRQFIEALGIRAADTEMPIRLLSGGNQQKVLLARWLAIDPRVLLLDEPTRGIDVGAKFDIAAVLRNLCAKGMSILFASSDLEEVVRHSDRVLVLRDRRKIAELDRAALSEDAILLAIATDEAQRQETSEVSA